MRKKTQVPKVTLIVQKYKWQQAKFFFMKTHKTNGFKQLNNIIMN